MSDGIFTEAARRLKADPNSVPEPVDFSTEKLQLQINELSKQLPTRRQELHAKTHATQDLLKAMQDIVELDRLDLELSIKAKQLMIKYLENRI